MAGIGYQRTYLELERRGGTNSIHQPIPLPSSRHSLTTRATPSYGQPPPLVIPSGRRRALLLSYILGFGHIFCLKVLISILSQEI